MAWEERNGNLYYYRKRRIGNRVVSEYVGTGDVAESLAILDELDAQQQKLEREQRRAERQQQQAVLGAIDEAEDATRTLLRAVLLANGYHMHKGQWRKRR